LADERGTHDDYTILCSNYTSTLNRYDYLTAQGKNIETYVKGKFYQMGPLSRYTCSGDSSYIMPCVNNICILRYQDRYDDEEKILAAASLNRAVDSQEFSFLEALDKSNTYCDNLIGTNSEFEKCSNDPSVWYNDRLDLLIFSRQGIDLTPPSFLESFLNLFINPIQSLISVINPEAVNVIPLVYEAQDYNNIYANVYKSKTITAILEPLAENPFVAADYKGFSEDICLAVERYDESKFGGAGIIACNQTDSTFYVYSQGRAAFSLWNDLTAQLRIS
jgi:hypothetical protein